MTLTSVVVEDVRFPTSLELDGSDSVNVDPDYSAAYVTLGTDGGEQGHGFVFTLGRGTEIVARAMTSYGQLLIGRNVDELIADLGECSRRIVHDSQMRWLGPEKGVSHMACGALLNALWDIRARRENKPLWLLLAEMPPDEVVDVIDFTHITDALRPDEALDILRRARPGRTDRVARLRSDGYPAYTTSPGWLGYSDEKLIRLSRAAADDGFTMIKLKVGGSLENDRRRLAIVRKELPDMSISIDANQRWDVPAAIEWIQELAEFDLYWVEEPTSTDDVLGHAAIRRAVAPVPIATGEAVANRIIFKQLLQCQSIDFLQVDATRVGGINENIATILLAAKFGVPVCPHAGGVGLCELAQHLSFFDYVAVSGSQEGRFIEFVDHLHDHFADPVRVENGRYFPTDLPGTGSRMHAESRLQWAFPGGAGWLDLGSSRV